MNTVVTGGPSCQGKWRRVGVTLWLHNATNVLVWLNSAGSWCAYDLSGRRKLPDTTYHSRFAAQQAVEGMVRT